jgi:hypothetical protein
MLFAKIRQTPAEGQSFLEEKTERGGKGKNHPKLSSFYLFYNGKWFSFQI